MNILITSGGTKVMLDRVRNISNMSMGTFGSRIALSALKRGHKVHFFHAKHSKTPFTFNADVFRDYSIRDIKDSLEELIAVNMQFGENYSQSAFSDFQDYECNLKPLVERKYDAVILAAAASDYGIDNYVQGKIRSAGDMTINLKPLPKLIGRIKEWNPNIKLVGFKLLVNSTDDELVNEATNSIEKNKCDMVVANDLRDIKNNDHRLIIVKPTSIKVYNTDYDDKYYLARQVIKELEAIHDSKNIA
jgi:phosphopantothenate--cysteine ligase